MLRSREFLEPVGLFAPLALLPLDQSATAARARVTKLFGFEGLDRVELEEASAGEIEEMAGGAASHLSRGGMSIRLVAAVVVSTVPVDGLMTMLKIHDETGRFLIAGDVLPAYGEVLAEYLAHPSVDVLGHRTDVPDLMRCSDVLSLKMQQRARTVSAPC